MGDYSSTGKVSGDIFESLRNYAPGAIRAINAVSPELAQTQLGIDQSMIGPYSELYKQGQLASSGTEADIAEGPGKRLVASADASQKALDPEYYAARGALGDSIGKYLGSYDPSHISPTELAEVSRGINATSGPSTPSNLSTAKNAMTFGSAGTQRWQNFGDAITRASSAIPTLKSGLAGFNISQSRGANPLPGNSSQASGTGFGFANNALSNIGQVANTGLSKEKTIPDQVNSAVGSY